MQLKTTVVLWAVICLGAGHLSGQPYSYFDANTFEGIWAQGTIPKDFTESWAAKVQQSQQPASNMATNIDHDELVKFWSTQYYFIDGMLQSGFISFNDPISTYLTQIKDRLLKDDPDLAKQIRVYLRKSPYVNASTVADGIILFNTGLVAYAQTEAELAFVMAHEIQHYKHGHSLKSFQEREKMLKVRVREYSHLHPIEKQDLLTMQSKEHEFEADEHGLELYLQSEYAAEAPGRVLTMLHQNYMPYGRMAVGSDFLSTKDFSLPRVFFRDSVSAISKEEDYFDETHTHPNIAKRRTAIDELQKYMQGGDKDFIAPQEQFIALRNLARFERVRELLLIGAYGDALYDIYVLRKDFPDSKFLDISEAKALYALAGFKASRHYNMVTRSTNYVEGPAQQVHHILRQFDRNQITAYALRLVMDNVEKYPEEKYLQKYASELARYMVIYCKLDLKDFETDGTPFTAFDKQPSDFETERKYMRAVQNHYRPVYKYVVQQEVQSGWMQKQFDKHQKSRDSIHAYINLSRKEKDNQRDEINESWEKGSNLSIDKMVLLDPTLILAKEDKDAKDFYKNFEKEQQFKTEVEALVDEMDIDAVMLFSDKMKPNEVELYNRVGLLKERMAEGRLHYEADLLPPGIELAHKLEKAGNVRYICSITGLVVDGRDSYTFNVYDLKQGKWVYGRKESAGFRLTSKDLRREIEKDLERIKG